MSIPPWAVIPFVAILLVIAIAPLVPRIAHTWHKNVVKLIVALVLGVPVAVWAWITIGPHFVEEALIDYVQFIVLLGSLFVVTGGLALAGGLKATPRNNTILLAIGAVLASIISTTGAAMLLIRTLLQINKERKTRALTVVFAIMVVANCGGMITPLGPPLYIGLMKGVPFAWTFSLIPAFLFINGLLLLTYYALDRRSYVRENLATDSDDKGAREPIRLLGMSNIIWVVVIVVSVVALNEYVWVKVGVQLAAALASYLITNKKLRFETNEFTWTPILEVAALFIGIFLTMIPALELLRSSAQSLPLNVYTIFGFTGALSAFLDNAPTYLAFLEMSTQLTVPGEVVVAGVPNIYLQAISLGAVTCGALTYIGNGPNFMVKAVAEANNVAMPSFGGFIVQAGRYLGPILISMVCILWGGSLLVQAIGVLIAVAIIVCYGMIILRSRTHTSPSQVAADANG